MNRNSPTRVLIYGSCVSRDILNYQRHKTQLVLVDYYARSSIASLGAQPIEMPFPVQNISSKFQRRMVERDIRKDFLNNLADLRFDLLLLDLIDERFNLHVRPLGRACTLSSELLSCGFYGDSDGGYRCHFGSEEFLQLWEAGWRILVNKLKCLGVLDRLLVNQVFWGSRTENGGNFEPHYSRSQIDSANRVLDRMYERIGADIPSDQFLRFDDELMTGSIKHTWGISPFHYVDSYYHAAIQQLSAWSCRKKMISTSEETVTAHRANCSIQEVVLKNDSNNVLVATVSSDSPETAQFAFYVFRNGERIHVQWYSSSRVLRLSINTCPGLYRVCAFFRSPEGKIIRKYSNSVFVHPVVYTLAQSFKKPQLEGGTLILSGEHWKFPALYYACSGQQPQPLFVMLSAEINRRKQVLPVFHRWTWAEAKKFPGHVLCIADPTLELHETMKVGWYIGTGEHDASEELASFIRHLAGMLGIPEGQIVIWGSSGGGFGALALASRIEQAIAVAINAQTNIFAYERVQDIESVRMHCFHGQTAKDILKEFGSRVDMAQAWKNNKSSRAILIQNTLDTHHYERHFKPFWEALGGTSEGGAAFGGRHYAWLFSDPRGHVPESEQMIPEILNLISQNSFTASSVAATLRTANE